MDMKDDKYAWMCKMVEPEVEAVAPVRARRSRAIWASLCWRACRAACTFWAESRGAGATLLPRLLAQTSTRSGIQPDNQTFVHPIMFAWVCWLTRKTGTCPCAGHRRQIECYTADWSLTSRLHTFSCCHTNTCDLVARAIQASYSSKDHKVVVAAD